MTDKLPSPRALHGQTLLVTGGTGLIGSRLLDGIGELGCRAVVVTRQTRRDTATIRYVQADLRKKKSIAVLARLVPACDALVHLAAALPDAGNALSANFDALVNLLDVPAIAAAKRIVYASSVDVYGVAASRKSAIGERTRCTPRTPYGLSKYIGEHILGTFCRTHAISLLTLRFSQVYGPGDHREIKFIPIVLRRIKDGLPVILFGDGSVKRNYLYVDDAVNAIRCALVTNRAGVYNIAPREQTSIAQAVRHLRRLLGDRVRIERRPQDRRPIHSILDVRKAERELAFTCATTFRDGIAKAVAVYFGRPRPPGEGIDEKTPRREHDGTTRGIPRS